MSSLTRPCSCSPRAAIGSSITSTRRALVHGPGDGDALALPARERARLPADVGDADLEVAEGGDRRPGASRRGPSQRTGPHERTSSRPRNRFSATLRWSARARSWYTVAMPGGLGGGRAWRSGPARRAASRWPRSGCERAAQHLDERRLAGAVVADDGGHRAGRELERHVAHRGDAAVVLPHARGRRTAARRRRRPESATSTVAASARRWPLDQSRSRSRETATMSTAPCTSRCTSRGDAEQDQPVGDRRQEHRGDQRVDEAALAAVHAGAAEDHGGEHREQGVGADRRLGPADAGHLHQPGEPGQRAGDDEHDEADRAGRRIPAR